MQRHALIIIVLLCLGSSAHATVTLSVGHHFVLPNTPGQTFDVLISSSGEGITAMSFYLEVNNGLGPAPIITGVNISTAPTIWAALPNNTSDYNYPYEPPTITLAFDVFLQSAAWEVPANGIAARIEVDTTGLLTGYFPLRLENDDFGETLLGDSQGVLNYVRVDGSLTIVPEPAAGILGLFAIAVLAASAIRIRAARTWSTAGAAVAGHGTGEDGAGDP
jgi:hypothetical protein